jgi:hypothetical protein
MTGIMCLYITGDCEVHKIPIPNGKVYKPIPTLADEEVLFTMLYYETINKKPSKLILANFDRFQLDSNGSYELTIDEIKKRYYNFDNYGFINAELLSKENCLQIPQATILPTANEKNSLYNYIKEKYPSLWSNFTETLECYIQNCIHKDLELKELVKKASILRNNALKKSAK